MSQAPEPSPLLGVAAPEPRPTGPAPAANGTGAVAPSAHDGADGRTPHGADAGVAAPMRQFHGIAVSPGLAIGPARVLDPRGLRLPPRGIEPAAVVAELDRLETALTRARLDAEQAQREAAARLGPDYGAILAAHARMIDDPGLRQRARLRIEQDHIAAEHAICEVLDRLATHLAALPNAHLAARAADVRDVQSRILDHLAGDRDRDGQQAPAHDGDTPSVLLAQDLSPSETAGLDPRSVLGFATEAGGRTSHTAIVAAGLEIPAVVALGSFLEAARLADTVIVDGDEGLVVLNPDAPTLARYRRASIERAARFADLARLSDLPSETRDGTAVELLGNIEFPSEAAACLQRGARGIGLFRTEFLYLTADRPPTEEEQYAAYAAVVRTLKGHPVTIRTLDLGADKIRLDAPTLGTGGAVITEPNPFLGLRSLRLTLRDRTLFRTQLRAILRAGALGDVRILFPLVSTLGELRQARALLTEVGRELAAEGVPCRLDLPVGAMIEVPAAALMADKIAREVDFFSIGTNDLVQYTLAVDRGNELVAGLYCAADPAVLRLIRLVVDAARPRNLPVNVCGTMGGDPLYTAVLIGLGLRQLSMPPHQIPEVKRVVRAIDSPTATRLAALAVDLDTAEESLAALIDTLRGTLIETAAPPTAITPLNPTDPEGPTPDRRRRRRGH